MRWVAFILVLVFAAPAGAEMRAPGGTYFAQGSFCAVEIVGQETAEGTLSGTLNLVDGPPVFFNEGPLVPAQIGVGFGIHLDVASAYSGLATVTTTHPPMGPNRVTRQTWTTTYTPGDIAYNGFTFEYDYELVEGAWTISAEVDGREIFHADFTVIDPNFAPAPPCGTSPLS